MSALIQESLLQGAPLNRGHDHAACASMLRAQGAWEAAAVEEDKAADAFQKCKSYSSDVGLQNTLQRMHDDHRHRAKEAKERAEAETKRILRHANKADIPTSPKSDLPPLSALDRFRIQSREMAATLAKDPTELNVTNPVIQPPFLSSSGPHALPSISATQYSTDGYNPYLTGQAASVTSSASNSPSLTQGGQTPMYDSQTTVGESYMVLGGARSDPNDPFNHFWKVLNEMLENLSQPVAWATVPLSSSGFTNMSHNDARSPTEEHPEAGAEALAKEKAGESEYSDDDTSDSDSFYLVETSSSSSPSRSNSPPPLSFPPLPQSRSSHFSTPSASRVTVTPGKTTGPSRTSTAATTELLEENARLRMEVESLKNTLEQTTKVVQERMEQEQVLRDSIMLVKREAQRAMASSVSLNRPLPPTPHGPPSPSVPKNLPPVQPSPLAFHHAPSPFMPNPNPLLPVRQASPLTLPSINNTNPLLALPTLPAIPLLDSNPTVPLMKRIKQLEDELKSVRSENEKQKTQIAKFRDKWEKLKESAKRKRSAREAANVIPEEDESAADQTSGPLQE